MLLPHGQPVEDVVFFPGGTLVATAGEAYNLNPRNLHTVGDPQISLPRVLLANERACTLPLAYAEGSKHRNGNLLHVGASPWLSLWV